MMMNSSNAIEEENHGSKSCELILLSVRYKCWTACQLVSLCGQN